MRETEASPKQAQEHLTFLRKLYERSQTDAAARVQELQDELRKAKAELSLAEQQMEHVKALEAGLDGTTRGTAVSSQQPERPTTSRTEGSKQALASGLLLELIDTMTEPRTQKDFLDFFKANGVELTKGTNHRVIREAMDRGLLVKRESGRPGRERFEYVTPDMA